jgi:predicted Ser/Thr protein kinase
VALVHLASWIAWPIALLSSIWLFLCASFSASNLGQEFIRTPAFPLSLGIGLITVLAGLALFLSADTVIFVTRNGIGVPFALVPGFWFRTKLAWSDLLAIDYKENFGGRLTLTFKKGNGKRNLSLELNKLSKAELEGLFMALDVWAASQKELQSHFKDLLDIRLKRLKEDEHIPSHTELWQDELARRFGSTNFIPLEPGETLREYHFKVERQLAFGGLSAIYLVSDPQKNMFVLKEAVVPDSSDETSKETSRKLLEREAKMLAQLSHEQIARIYDHFQDKDRQYLLLEYIPGSDLRRFIKDNGRQPVAVVLKWAREMTQLLVYLHEQEEPIVHRDFSPDNMILKKDGSIALIDFGAANFFLGTATGTMIGKQAYIAPEQLRGKAKPASDLYALGGCLYYLLTGCDPEPLSVSHPAKHVAEIPEALDRLIAGLTDMEAEDRPQSARQVLATLEEIENSLKTETISTITNQISLSQLEK